MFSKEDWGLEKVFISFSTRFIPLQNSTERINKNINKNFIHAISYQASI